ncbi:c-type cytochrome [Alkalilacustris brevis]|uniref:c-type cytochrome n=1 Tax=Alkalilacustris brevis TaxID=2026338 RepID=UPI001EE3E101|nr:c-type cytochrome [Alkalilacustris brevis]
MKVLTSTVAILMLATPAFASDSITIDVAKSEKPDQYLTDDQDRPVYIFSTDTRASEEQEAEMSCTSTDCLEAWPPVTTPSEPLAGEGADASLLGTTEHDSQQVVTYDGMPLYYFARDEGAEAPQGHEVEAFGGEWSLVNPAASIEAGDIATGESMFADSCAQCHGRAGRGMASFPSIAGKNAEYISGKLVRYRAGETIGPNSALMRPVAAELSDEDIANLAAFISTGLE